jgi:small subunit ribosomal protein S1
MAEENKKAAEETEVSEVENQNQEATPEETPVKKTAKKVEKVIEDIIEDVTEAVEDAVEVVKEMVEDVVEDVKEAIEDNDSKSKSKKGPKGSKFQPELTEYVAPEDFNWAAFEEGVESYSESQLAEMDKKYEDTLTSINEHEVLVGKVVSVNKKEVVVNIGYKSEGVIAASEFRYNPDLKAGDDVEVYVESQEDKSGQMIISHRTARVHHAWDRVNNSLEKNEIITGFVKCRTKGGLIVDVFGLEAFLPGSQIDVKPIRDYDVYVGKNMEFKVVKINQEFKNVVVSHKALIEAELEEQKKDIISKLEKGQVLEGTVKNITSYGVFIDLGGVDGLIHITDLSWGRINHPEEVVTLDEKINVVILDFDDDKKRIALGLKQLHDHPWDKIQEDLEIGKTVTGKVVVLADYGAFVEIAAGVEGLIHVSEMSWSQHLRSAQDFLKVGDEVKAIVLTLDKEERKMSLGMKQLTPDPWAEIEAKYPLNSKHSATVRNFTNFGVFVELEEGVDGLIHISDLSWSKKVKHPSEFCNIGDVIEAIVLEVDKENRRLSLGHKQLEENPWDVFETLFEAGSTHQGTITAMEGTNAIINLPYGVEGTCTKKNLKKADGSTAKVEETLDFVVLEFNKSSKKIAVSHTATFEESEELAATEGKRKTSKAKDAGSSNKAVDDLNKNQEKTTLGDLGVLGNLKADMEKAEAKGDKKKK